MLRAAGSGQVGLGPRSALNVGGTCLSFKYRVRQSKVQHSREKRILLAGFAYELWAVVQGTCRTTRPRSYLPTWCTGR